jgi:cyclic pyranopterin phosphate synthase
MAPEGVAKISHDEVLRFEEIARIVRALASAGIRKIRLTGGEPLLRRGVVELVRMLRGIPGIEELALTTNGSKLREFARPLKDAGLARVNVSLDSLDRGNFARITRGGKLEDVLAGISAAEEAGFKPLKINAVLLKGINDSEAEDFARLTMTRPLQIRFIERMPVTNCGLHRDSIILENELMGRISRLGTLEELESQEDGGPGVIYRFRGTPGAIGFISPISKPFCGRCNRIRLTSDGKFRSCLIDGGELDVRRMLRGGCADDEILSAFKSCVEMKPRIRGLRPIDMSVIGG